MTVTAPGAAALAATTIGGRTGYEQADASATFDRLFTGRAARAIAVGCWAHARRPLVELADTDCRVAYPLQLIRRVYRIERLATGEVGTLDDLLPHRWHARHPEGAHPFDSS